MSGRDSQHGLPPNGRLAAAGYVRFVSDIFPLPLVVNRLVTGSLHVLSLFLPQPAALPRLVQLKKFIPDFSGRYRSL